MTFGFDPWTKEKLSVKRRSYGGVLKERFDLNCSVSKLNNSFYFISFDRREN